MSELRRSDITTNHPRMIASTSYQPTLSPVPSGSNTPNSDYKRKPHIHIAAIDNSLSFPHEHPQGWRSYTYGWLYLPVSVIGRPFSEKTRSHFLPLLTSKAWWEETTFQLERLFVVDPDFHPKMFAVGCHLFTAVLRLTTHFIATTGRNKGYAIVLPAILHNLKYSFFFFVFARTSLEHCAVVETHCGLRTLIETFIIYLTYHLL